MSETSQDRADDRIMETEMTADGEEDGLRNGGHGRAKRIAALLGVLLLILLVAATFGVACLDFEGKDQVFSALLLCDIVIPVFLWFILHFLA